MCYPETNSFQDFFNEVRFIKRKFIVSVVAVAVAAFLGGYSYFRLTHFNQQVSINGLNVGGLTAKQALSKLKNYQVTQTIYLKGEVLEHHQRSSSGFSNQDLAKIKSLVKKQWTFLPSAKKKQFLVEPKTTGDQQTKSVQAELKSKLQQLNRKRTAPVDAQAVFSYGKVTITAPKAGNQYNVDRLLKQYEKQQYLPKVKLTVKYLQPLKASSSQVQTEKQKLLALKDRTVSYQVQETKYNLATKDLLKKATYQDGKYYFQETDLANKISEINQKQATLGKQINFKTNSGNTVQVSGGTYGWALDTSSATKHLENAWLENKSTLEAKPDIYGKGYLTYGLGYNNLTNDGIGSTYAEVSISAQRVWLYKNGQQVATSNIVTGKHSTGEDTPKGVWYIMYKQSPSVLSGSEAGNSNYSVKVKYWAQFTNSGCGFHDASWRTNWSSTAYLNDGSGGCANTPSDKMENIYNNLSQGEPVIVY